MKFSILSSGSKQNCFYVESGGSAILIDIGLHFSVMKEHLASVGGDVSRIRALFVTHEHWDHIQGIRSFMKNLPVPVYMDEASRKSARLKMTDHRPISHGEEVAVGEFSVLPFQVSHDAANTYGYRIRAGNSCLAMASDIGSYDDEILEYFRDAGAIAIESNYDIEMLKKSHYPAYLKRRIHGKNGHLSNDDAAEFLEKALSERTKNVFFLHLSENNNSRAIVENMIDGHFSLRYPGVRFHVSFREKPTSLIEL